MRRGAMGTMGTVPQQEPQLQSQPEPIMIHIHKGNPANVDQDPVYVYKSKKDTVQWSLDPPPPGPADWLVVFEGPSPFERDHFEPAHPGNTDIVVPAGDREYKYTVYVDGKRGADPMIIVRP